MEYQGWQHSYTQTYTNTWIAAWTYANTWADSQSHLIRGIILSHSSVYLPVSWRESIIRKQIRRQKPFTGVCAHSKQSVYSTNCLLLLSLTVRQQAIENWALSCSFTHSSQSKHTLTLKAIGSLLKKKETNQQGDIVNKVCIVLGKRVSKYLVKKKKHFWDIPLVLLL